MSITSLLFLSSGLFLGWSLGAQDASNVFGTAVASRMVRFKTAAFLCSIFLTLGAVLDGVGAAHTLGTLGSVNAIAGAFVTSFAAAFTVLMMTKLALPVSVSQAVVGSIIGWNLFTDSVTDVNSVVKIASTWVACPVLGALIGALVFAVFRKISKKVKFSLLHRDALLRFAMIVTGAFGSYALGANNMANVVGVFIPVVPFKDFSFFGTSITPVHQLFFIGSVAVAVGVYTYSYNVMMTVGKGILPLTPFASWVVVLSQSLVLFIFASEGLEHFLASHGLPTIPLVPVSSTQAVVGAVIGIGLAKGAAKNIQWIVVLRIICGWVISPVCAAIICFFALFFMQNVFNQTVFIPKTYIMSEKVYNKLVEEGYSGSKLTLLKGEKFTSGVEFIDAVENRLGKLNSTQEQQILGTAEWVKIYIDPEKIDNLDTTLFTPLQINQIKELSGRRFNYRWELQNALIAISSDWAYRPETVLNKKHNKLVAQNIRIIEDTFVVRDRPKKKFFRSE